MKRARIDWVVADRVTHRVKRASTALAYLHTSCDRIFDLHVEGGFSDDIVLLKETWLSLQPLKTNKG